MQSLLTGNRWPFKKSCKLSCMWNCHTHINSHRALLQNILLVFLWHYLPLCKVVNQDFLHWKVYDSLSVFLFRIFFFCKLTPQANIFFNVFEVGGLPGRMTSDATKIM